MNRRTIILLYVCIFSSVSVWAQTPLGLRAASFLRGILLGTAIRVTDLRTNVDGGQYNKEVKDNYQLVVPEGELKPRNIWQGENQYNWVDGDYLLGAPNTTGWVQQNLMRIRGHNLV